jgi:hypothetical protein
LNTSASGGPSGSGAISIVPPAASATVGPQSPGSGTDAADEVGELIGADRRGRRTAQHRERERLVDGIVEQPFELLG